MTLRLRIWAWALIVGVFAYPDAVYYSYATSEKFWSDSGGILTSIIFLATPFLLLIASVILIPVCGRAKRQQSFTWAEKIFYVSAIIFGCLPALLVLAFGTAVFLGWD